MPDDDVRDHPLRNEMHAIVMRLAEVNNLLHEQDRVALQSKNTLDRIDRTVNGDAGANVIGLNIRVDRLERSNANLSKFVWAMLGIVVPLFAKMLWEFVKTAPVSPLSH